MHFSDFNLNNPLLKAIFEKNYETPTKVQILTIPLVLAKKNVIASAQTGTGKTAAFALPILQLLFHQQDTNKEHKKIRALIVSPTRELAVQINEEFTDYSKYTKQSSTVVYGGISIDAQKKVLKKGFDILIATPGRLLDLCKQEIVDLSTVEILVLDEADLMLDMGFIDDIRKIDFLCPNQKQILLFSATMPSKVVHFAKNLLSNPEIVEVISRKSEKIKVQELLYYVPKPNKIELCLHLLRNTIKGNILIFRRTRNGVDNLEQTLLKNGFKVETLHGEKNQNLRQNSLSKFKNNEVNILIATDVASRGIDIEDLDVVINFDLPNISETYVHRIGRTARAGKKGTSYSFCSLDEKKYVVAIQKIIKKAIPVVEDHPYALKRKEKAINLKKKNTKQKNSSSKHKKSRKSSASKKNKKRWY
ncbi:DEAD/DEAH box helicase [Flavobacteriaceae bacterium]|jgi:ATP-dependent RNA helicase RhlE|nr:DEAD/DEAH box helicase [Polaribacter sp.]MDB9913205.1 DEAD/DEAH box helicase [Flavobacteriaceae bacterium]MDC0539046.1 DEAD/DEAH box helicase [Flavobacteriaceae bacterium]